MHDLVVAALFLVMVMAPCLSAMTTEIQNEAEQQIEEPSELA